MQELIAIIISLIFLLYSFYIYSRFGVLSSVSASTYELQGQNRWIFLATLWGMGILNLFMGMGVFGFMASAGIIFAGMTIDHEKGPGATDEIHTIGTVLAIVSTFAGFIVLHGLFYPSAILVWSILIILAYRIDNKIWWIEIASMILTTAGYIAIY